MIGRVLTVLTIVAAAGAAATAQQVKVPGPDFGRYHALVIGNNDYEFLPKLTTALVDAVAVAELLRLRYGFKVKLLVNANRLQILDALNAYRRASLECLDGRRRGGGGHSASGPMERLVEATTD